MFLSPAYLLLCHRDQTSIEKNNDIPGGPNIFFAAATVIMVLLMFERWKEVKKREGKSP